MALTKISRSLLDTGVSDSSDATAITIDSSENVGIGSSTPTNILELKKGSATSYDASAKQDGGARLAIFNSNNTTSDTFADIHFQCHSTSPGEARIGMRLPSVGNSELFFITEGSGTLSEKMRITSTGQIQTTSLGVSTPTFSFNNDTDTGMTRPTSNTLQFVCGGTVKNRISSDGLLFNSDTAAANALNDYEEGTWTPQISNNVNNHATHTTQVGNYVKIGNIVTVHGTIQCSSGANAGGDTMIRGLPFAATSTTGRRCVGAMGAMNGCGTSAEKLRLVLDPGESFIYIVRQTGQNYSHDADLNDAVDIYGFQITYTTN